MNKQKIVDEVRKESIKFLISKIDKRTINKAWLKEKAKEYIKKFEFDEIVSLAIDKTTASFRKMLDEIIDEVYLGQFTYDFDGQVDLLEWIKKELHSKLEK